eukprot:m.112850 g.112850  ORF g.112850 m.112850 type:complete len:1029 (-) comp14106_c0_seq1:32-3118(-)
MATAEVAFLECLAGCTNIDVNIRRQAEESLTQYACNRPEFGACMVQIIVNQSVALHLRMLAAIVLRQYIESHWTDDSDKFTPPLVDPAHKAIIRDTLAQVLADPSPKLRCAAAHGIAKIAHYDFPEQWPGLFDGLLQSLGSGSPELVHGAIRVLIEFSRDFTDNQLSDIIPALVPEMLKFASDAQRDVRTRACSVQIFTSLLESIHIMGIRYMDEDSGELVQKTKATVERFVKPLLANWMAFFFETLRAPDSPTIDIGLKRDVLQCIALLLLLFPKQMVSFMDNLLPVIWGILVNGLKSYVSSSVLETEHLDEPVDEEGEVLGFESMIYSLFEVILNLVTGSKMKAVRKGIASQLDELIFYVISYGQMTEDQAERWLTDPTVFVLEEMDEDPTQASLRLYSLDLLLELLDRYGKKAGFALVAASEKLIQASQASRVKQEENWWKPAEAALMACGSAAQELVPLTDEGFNLSSWMSVIVEFISVADTPFLQGRALWMAGQFSQALPADLLERLLNASVSAMSMDQPIPVQISAVSSVGGFCSGLRDHSSESLPGTIARIIQALVALAVKSNSEVVRVILDTLTSIASVQPSVTMAMEAQLVPLATACFIRYSSDCFILDAVRDLVEELGKVPGMSQSLQQRMLPSLVGIIQQHEKQELVGVLSYAVDTVYGIIKYSPVPFSEVVMNVFPLAVQLMLQSTDNSALDSGISCLMEFCTRGMEQIASWTDAANTGLGYVMQVVIRLLHPDTPEEASSQAGRLVNRIFATAQDKVAGQMNDLLLAVLMKLQGVKQLTNIQGLILVFAQLIRQHQDEVLSFLSSKNALQLVFSTWCSNQDSFWGKYEINVSISVLAQLFASKDSRLMEVIVQGDEKEKAGGKKIRTRSSSKANVEYEQIPLYAKICKILIKDYNQVLEEDLEEDVDYNDDEDDDDYEDDEDDFMGNWESEGGHKNPFASADAFYASDVIDLGFGGMGDEEDDEFVKNDPIYSLDRKACILQVFRDVSQDQAVCATLLPLLNETEKATLSKALSN